MTSTAPRKTRLFLSYSRKDLVFAQELHQQLEAAGYDVLLDRTDIAAGEDWQARLGRLIVEADTVVFCLSPYSAASKICGWEVAEAERLGKRILPVVAHKVLDADVPPSLAKLNFIFMNEHSSAKGFTTLRESLEADLPWLREHTRLGDLALTWQARPGNAGVLRGSALEQAERWIASQPRNAALATDLHRSFISASRKAATLRQRNWIVGASAVVALSLGLAGWSEVNRQEAVKQQSKAERLALSATNASSALVFDIVNKFENVEGMPVEVSHNILLLAFKMQADMASNEDATPELRQLMANTARQASATFLRQGDVEGALMPVTKAIEVLRALATEEPDNREFKSSLAEALDQLGDVLLGQRKPEDAKAAFLESYSIVEVLVANEGDVSSLRIDLAVYGDKLGDMDMAAGNLEAARKRYDESYDLRVALAEELPDNNEGKRSLSVSHFKIGDLLREMGQLEAAVEQQQQALTIDSSLAESDSRNTLWQRDLAVTHSRLGELYMDNKEYVKAEEQFQAGLAIAEKLGVSDPGQAEWQRDRSVGNRFVGEALQAQNKHADAVPHFEASIAILEKQIEREPANTQLLTDLSGNLRGLAVSQIATGDNAGAIVSRARDISVWQKLVSRDAMRFDWRREAVTSHLQLALLGEQRAPNIASALAIVKFLNDKGDVQPDDPALISELEETLSTLQP